MWEPHVQLQHGFQQRKARPTPPEGLGDGRGAQGRQSLNFREAGAGSPSGFALGRDKAEVLQAQRCGCLSNTPQAHPRPQARVSFSLPSLLKPPDSQIFALQPVPPPKPSGPACLIRAPSNAPQDSSGKAVTLSPSIQCEGKRPLPEPAFATFSGPFQR